MAENDTGKLINRFEELASRAEKLCFPQETKFLNLAEQDVLEPSAASRCSVLTRNRRGRAITLRP